MLGEDLPEFRNRPLFPGPGGVEVGLSQEGGTLGGRGRKGALSEADAPGFGRKAALRGLQQARRQSTALESDKQNSLLVLCINARGLS